MPYPSSAAVSSGQPTASSHYNSLRSDALYWGSNERDSAGMGALFQRYENNLQLEYLAVNRLRVPASPEQPVCLVISGVALVCDTPADLPLGSAPAGPAAWYYVFALQSPGSTRFSLDINTSPAESNGRRCIGSFYWNGLTMDQSSLTLRNRQQMAQCLNYCDPQLCQGRLTLQSGQPVPEADLSAAGMLYFCPCQGSQMALWSAAGWRVHSFQELSLTLAGLSSYKNYDIFAEESGDSLQLKAVVWTANTTRAEALLWQDGIALRSTNPGQRYLGTIRTSAAGQCEDSRKKRFVWNAQHRRPRPLRVSESALSWTYNVRTLRPFNNNQANRLEWVQGLSEDSLSVTFCATAKAASATFYGIGLGVDSLIADDPQVIKNSGTSTSGMALMAIYHGLPAAAGYHYMQLLEIAGNAVVTTFYGSNGLDTELSGASGILWA